MTSIPHLLNLIGWLVSILTWTYPQPKHSSGLLVVYGGQRIVQANADYHGYTLAPYDGCGFAAISPSMLGMTAWVRRPGYGWQGPCLAVDIVSRHHAYDSIYVRKEIAEISRDTAAALGFDNGGRDGYIWFGTCPPDRGSAWLDPMPYKPPLVWDRAPYEHTPSFYPYPDQQFPPECRRLDEGN